MNKFLLHNIFLLVSSYILSEQISPFTFSLNATNDFLFCAIGCWWHYWQGNANLSNRKITQYYHISSLYSDGVSALI